MNDLINRQDVLKLIRTLPSEEGMTKGLLETSVNQLPSAESEIIRCKDCKHYNAGFECLIEGYGIERDREWYCGDAERRGEEDD